MITIKDIGVVLPVREGSSRIENKVLLPFGDDESLLEWKINQLKAVIDPKQIVVSTDSQKLIDIAIDNGVSFSFRDQYLCDGHKASFSEVISGVVKNINFKHIAWVTVVVPLMKPEEYINAFKKYVENINQSSKYESLVSVNLLKEYFWNDEGPLNYRADKNHTISQDLPNLYRVTNGLYMCSKKIILKSGYFLTKTPYMFQVDKVSGIDIDELEDYEIANNLYDHYLKKVSP